MASVFANQAKEVNNNSNNSQITSIDGVGPKIANVLISAGYDTIQTVTNADLADLANLEGIGEKTAQRIYRSAQSLETESK